jgi:hypothetical protein
MNPTASTPTTSSSSSSTTEIATNPTTNDNSNPQQGTGTGASNSSKLSKSSKSSGACTKTKVTHEKSSLPSSGQPQGKDEGVISKEEVDTTANDTATGTGTGTGTTDTTRTDTDKCHFKIPPFKRDSRKLFVGGLPPEGTYYNRNVDLSSVVELMFA